MKKERILVSGALVLLLLTLIGCGSTTHESELTDVSVRLPIPVIEAGQTPFYVALDEGFYEDHGLDVTFNLGTKELNPVKMVATGTDDFGVLGGPDTLLVARSKGQPLVAIGVLHKDSNFPVLLTLTESNITDVKQLEGKDVGFFYGHISTDVLRNLFRSQGVTVDEVDVGFNYNQLIAKKVDAQWAFRVTAGVDLPAQGVDVHEISPSKYGIATHGYTLFTTEEMIEKHPEKVQAFLTATRSGVATALEDRKAALAVLAKHGEDLNLDFESKKLDMYSEVTSNSEEFPIGYMDEDMFQETYDRLVEEGVIENEFDVKEAFTTQFLENAEAKENDN